MSYPAPSEWYCDSCHQTITDPNNSLVVWREDKEHHEGDFLVVHKGNKCDPGSHGRDDYPMSQEIAAFQGWDGQAYLLSMLSDGPFHMRVRSTSGGQLPKDMHQFVDLFRRVQTPYYEEARRHFKCEAVREEFGDAGTDQVYRPESLRWIADHDGGCNEG